MNADTSDAALARSIAGEAGALLLTIQRRAGLVGRERGDIGDREANALILARLRGARPNDAILSEEADDDHIRLAARRVWIVDPLDGTREYASGIDEWAVHIGLAIDGVARDGAVAVPPLGIIYATDAPRKRSPANQPIRMVVSRSRAPAITTAVARSIAAETVPMGSAGAKAMAVVDGRADIYLHEGGQYEWDNCAPVAVALAAGLHASRIDGSALVYNRTDPMLPDLLICRPELAESVLTAVRACR